MQRLVSDATKKLKGTYDSRVDPYVSRTIGILNCANLLTSLNVDAVAKAHPYDQENVVFIIGMLNDVNLLTPENRDAIGEAIGEKHHQGLYLILDMMRRCDLLNQDNFNDAIRCRGLFPLELKIVPDHLVSQVFLDGVFRDCCEANGDYEAARRSVMARIGRLPLPKIGMFSQRNVSELDGYPLTPLQSSLVKN